MNNCHFEPMPRLSFRAEGEKSCVSIPTVLRGGVRADNLTVLEAVCGAGRLRSPPIPSFPPIRKKGGGHGWFPMESVSEGSVRICISNFWFAIVIGA